MIGRTRTRLVLAAIGVVMLAMPTPTPTPTLRAQPTASTHLPSPASRLGTEVRLALHEGTGVQRLQGELLAVDSTRVWLLVDGRATAVERATIDDSRVRVHRAGRRLAWIVGAIGAVATGFGMTGACQSVEGQSCGGVFPAMAAVWAVFALISGEFMEMNTWQRIPVARWEQLALYARYPQGAPASFMAEPPLSRRQ
jgi:hypothetical protein